VYLRVFQSRTENEEEEDEEEEEQLGAAKAAEMEGDDLGVPKPKYDAFFPGGFEGKKPKIVDVCECELEMFSFRKAVPLILKI
jgi:hypothetical protein